MFWQQLPAPTAKSAGMTVKENSLVKCDSCTHPLSWCWYKDFSSVEAEVQQIFRICSYYRQACLTLSSSLANTCVTKHFHLHKHYEYWKEKGKVV